MNGFEGSVYIAPVAAFTKYISIRVMNSMYIFIMINPIDHIY